MDQRSNREVFLRARLDALESRCRALDAGGVPSYAEFRSRQRQLPILQQKVAILRERLQRLERGEVSGPYWDGGELVCAGCARAERLYRPGLIRWSQPEDEAPPLGVVLQSGSFGRNCGAFVICEACVPLCSRCCRPRPRPAVVRALATASEAMTGETCVTWFMEPCSDDHLGTFAATVISSADGTVYAGPGAGPLPQSPPLFVLTAWNPAGEDTDFDLNNIANNQLHGLLLDIGAELRPVVGQSPDASWQEDSFLVAGLSRADAAAIGARFGQLAIFELQDDDLLVVDCTTGEPRRTVSRTRNRR